MKQVCGMCTFYKGGCTSHELCVNGSEFIDKRETVRAMVCIDDDIAKNVHIIVEGDIIHDYETFGKHLFDVVQREIREYMKGVKI